MKSFGDWKKVSRLKCFLEFSKASDPANRYLPVTRYGSFFPREDMALTCAPASGRVFTSEYGIDAPPSLRPKAGSERVGIRVTVIPAIHK